MLVFRSDFSEMDILEHGDHAMKVAKKVSFI